MTPAQFQECGAAGGHGHSFAHSSSSSSDEVRPGDAGATGETSDTPAILLMLGTLGLLLFVPKLMR